MKYVVRVSTCVAFIGPTSPVFYGRSHWAIETMLSQPEYAGLQWTSFRPNLFAENYLASAASWIKEYRKTGRKEALTIIPAADIGVAVIDPKDVGRVGARLLALDDPTAHNRAHYILNGPEDVDGNRIVELAERLSGVSVPNVEFMATGWIKELAGVYSEKLLPSIVAGV